jgi:hypothetical protein
MTRYPLNLPVIYVAARCPLTSNRQMQNGQTLHSFVYAPHALIAPKAYPWYPRCPLVRQSPETLPCSHKSMVLKLLCGTCQPLSKRSFFLPICYSITHPVIFISSFNHQIDSSPWSFGFRSTIPNLVPVPLSHPPRLRLAIWILALENCCTIHPHPWECADLSESRDGAPH